MPEGTEGTIEPGNTGEGTQTTIDVSKIVADLTAANTALTEKEKQYKGLQTTYNALHESNKSLLSEKDTWTAEKTTLQNQLDQSSNDQGDFKAQFDELTGKYTALETKNTELENKDKRTGLILDEFPDLLGFEKKGLLPEFDGDEEGFKTKLTDFKEALGSNAQQAVEDELDGAGPDGTDGDNTAPDRDKLLDEMTRIAGDPLKSDRYRDLQEKLDEIDTKAAK